MSIEQTMVKISLLPDLAKAARLLKKHGLIDEDPLSLIKQYVLANPDIDELLGTTPPLQLGKDQGDVA